MAQLSAADRALAWQRVMTDLSGRRETVGALTKADLRAAVDAIDTWVDDNASAFNLAIPQPARGVLSTKQKAELLLVVVRRRYEVQ